MGDHLTAAELVTARRWLDERSRGDAGTSDGWRERAVADGASRIGIALARQSDHPAALSWLTAASAVAPVHSLADIGGYLVDAGDLTAAEVALRRGALAGDASAALHLGRLLLFLERDDEADKWLRSALETDPTSADELLRDLRRRGADTLADHWSEIAAELGNGEAAVQLAWSALARDEAAAVSRWVQIAGQLDAADIADQRVAIALELARMRRWAEAAEVVAPAAAVDARGACGLLGEVEEALGHIDNARAAYQRGAESGDGEAAHNLAMIYHREGDRDQAWRWLLEGARRGADKSMYNLAVLDPRPDSSARRMVLAAAHGHAHAALRVGMAEAEAGRVVEAKLWLSRALELGDPKAELALSAVEQASAKAQRRRGRGRP
jgi:tetratricopeptide (TPR) repeat protein